MNKKIQFTLLLAAIGLIAAGSSFLFRTPLVTLAQNATRQLSGAAWGADFNDTAPANGLVDFADKNEAGSLGGIGWISFNCLTSGDCASGHNYRLELDNTTGAITGYAWSGNYGWIKFGGLAHYGFPVADGAFGTAATDAKLLNGTMVGWARACSGTFNPAKPLGQSGDCGDASVTRPDGWDGWISLSGKSTDGKDYGVKLSSDGKTFTGAAWGGGSDIANGGTEAGIGWISFNNPVDPAAGCVGSGCQPRPCSGDQCTTVQIGNDSVTCKAETPDGKDIPGDVDADGNVIDATPHINDGDSVKWVATATASSSKITYQWTENAVAVPGDAGLAVTTARPYSLGAAVEDVTVKRTITVPGVGIGSCALVVRAKPMVFPLQISCQQVESNPVAIATVGSGSVSVDWTGLVISGGKGPFTYSFFGSAPQSQNTFSKSFSSKQTAVSPGSLVVTDSAGVTKTAACPPLTIVRESELCKLPLGSDNVQHYANAGDIATYHDKEIFVGTPNLCPIQVPNGDAFTQTCTATADGSPYYWSVTHTSTFNAVQSVAPKTDYSAFKYKTCNQRENYSSF